MSGETAEELRRCSECGLSLAPLKTPHVVRRCEQCAKDTYLMEPGKDGIGIVVRAGDRLVFPAGSIRLSLDPREGMDLTKAGVVSFVSMLFHCYSGPEPLDVDTALQKHTDRAVRVIEADPELRSVDWTNEDEARGAWARLQDSWDRAGRWAVVVLSCAERYRSATQMGDHSAAALAVRQLAIAHNMMEFVSAVLETVWRGRIAGRLLKTLDGWRTHRDNSSEKYWQHLLCSQSWLLTQLFATPCVIIDEQVYVGGQLFDGRGGRLADVLLRNSLTGRPLVVEIKTPTAPLLGRKYRASWPASRELTGAEAQIRDYRDSFVHNCDRLGLPSDATLTWCRPKCLLIIGDAERQLDTDEKRLAFEQHRDGVNDIEIIAFDELFDKAEHLVTAFEPSMPGVGEHG